MVTPEVGNGLGQHRTGRARFEMSNNYQAAKKLSLKTKKITPKNCKTSKHIFVKLFFFLNGLVNTIHKPFLKWPFIILNNFMILQVKLN